MQKIHRFSLSGYELMPEEVFISYGSADRERIQDLVSRLRQAGVTVWIDEAGIEGAAMWSEEIVSAINDCKVLILSISSNSTKSKNVVRELALASEEEKTILPVFLEPTEIPESMKYQLAGIQRVEYFAGNEEEAIGSVLRALSRLGITTNDNEPGQATTKPTQTKRKSTALAIAAVAVVALLAAIFLLKQGDQPANKPNGLGTEKPSAIQSEAKPLDKNRIVLLPFKNIGTNGENEHIVEGIVDDLNTMLTNVKGLRVIGSASAKTYRDSNKTPAEIGQELNAGTLLQGSIQKTGSDLKINVRLIDTTSSENIWANSFSGSDKDRSKFQQEIIQSIVSKTKGTILNQSELGLLSNSDTKNTEAYSLVKRGNELLAGSSRNENKKAKELFLKAIELDPNYADAFYGLALVEYQLPYLSLKKPEESIPSAKNYLNKALRINSKHLKSRVLNIVLTLKADWNTEEIHNDFTNLLSQHKNNPLLAQELSDIYTHSGQAEKAIKFLNEGLNLDPKNSAIHAKLALQHLINGNINIAEKHNLEAIKLSPNYQMVLHIRSLILMKLNRHSEIEELLQNAIHNDDRNPVTIMSLGIVFWKKNKKEEAYKLLNELLHRRNFEYIKGGILARFFLAIGDKEKSFKWLKVSRDEKDTDFFHMYHWPIFDEVRNNSEFIQIYRDSGLLEFLTNQKNNDK